MGSRLKRALRSSIPLPLRMRLAIWLNRQPWFTRDYLAVGWWATWGCRILKRSTSSSGSTISWATRDGTTPRMNYSRSSRCSPSRRMFFDDLVSVVRELGLQPSDIGSILEVECSLGYLLRHLEVEVFPGCRELLGIDIDGPAIRKGTDYLKRHGSKVASLRATWRTSTGCWVPGPSIWSSPPVSSAISTNRMPPAWCPCCFAGQTRCWLSRAWPAPAATTTSSIGPKPPRTTSSSGFTTSSHGFGRWGTRGQEPVEGAKLYNLQTIHFVFAVPG